MNQFLLDDQTMRRFVRRGYIVLKPGYKPGFDEMIYRKVEETIEKHGNPGNNLLPRLPELQPMLDHPVVVGALQSILGSDYYLHLHRHLHERGPGGADQKMHKDSPDNSRFAADDTRRHHRTRWCMLFYYPQDTPVELGPTAVVPKSQYLNTQWPRGEEEIALHGPAGTVVIAHYDILHRGMENQLDHNRHMIKFLFARMSEPGAPSWNHIDREWEQSDDDQAPIWQDVWRWHLGNRSNAASTRKTVEDSISDMPAESLSSATEIEGLRAAYGLGSRGSESTPLLIDALRSEESDAARNAAYGFNMIGSACVPALVDATSDESRVRARIFDVLGDMGLSAAASVPALLKGLEDPDEDPRRRAAEALGTAGQSHIDLGAPLAEMLRSDPSGEVRRTAALSVARLGTKAAAAVPALSEAMMDENHYVRGYSVHALTRIGTPDATAAVLKHLQAMRWD